jgi:hypothetical protein
VTLEAGSERRLDDVVSDFVAIPTYTRPDDRASRNEPAPPSSRAARTPPRGSSRQRRSAVARAVP